MAGALVETIRINRPPEQVFAFTSNFENDPQWRSEVREMRWLDPGEIRLGRQVREQSSVFGRSLVTVTKVTELEPGRRIKVETVSGLTPVVSIRTCEPDGGGTRFTYSLEADVSGVWFFRLLQPVLIPYYNRQMKGYLQRLKQVLEAA